MPRSTRNTGRDLPRSRERREFVGLPPARFARAFGALLSLPPPDLRFASSAQMGEADRQRRGESAPDVDLATGRAVAGAVPTRVERMREGQGSQPIDVKAFDRLSLA